MILTDTELKRQENVKAKMEQRKDDAHRCLKEIHNNEGIRKKNMRVSHKKDTNSYLREKESLALEKSFERKRSIRHSVTRFGKI